MEIIKHYETVKVEVADRLYTITLNRPEKYNALNQLMVSELGLVFKEFSAHPAAEVGIITGEGKAFMSGADISEIIQRQPAENEKYNREIIDAFNFIEKQDKPVIAAVNGFALGGGFELALACTFRIAATTAKFGLPEVGLGILPGAGGPQRLVRLIGKEQTMRLVLTGEIISAEEAFRLRLVLKVVSPDQLMSETRKLTARILEKAPLAVRWAKNAIEMGMDMPMVHAIQYTDRNLGLLIRSEDMKEGMKAFLEKRKPVFKGS